MFRNRDLFPSSSEGREIPILLGPLENVNPITAHLHHRQNPLEYTEDDLRKSAQHNY
jgi:hypothetical protein